ncbi:hypothetical protein DV737_g3758, partial [Chaetothyriales sp. CBS 132003]
MDKLHTTPAATEPHGFAFIDTSDPNLYIAATAIIFNPLFWNIVARAEYHTHVLTHSFGSARNGCYALALAIFSLGILRDHLYKTALDSQPLTPQVHHPWLAIPLFAFGQLLVLSSMWALGLTGTYLGDYFGILMDHKVEGFPFNLTLALGAPMYVGSTLCFLATALWSGRGAGLLLTALVALTYAVATVWFEDPFTSMIYANKDSAAAEKVPAAAEKVPAAAEKVPAAGSSTSSKESKKRA